MNGKRPTIFTILLGGTIVCTYDADGSMKPSYDLQELLGCVDGIEEQFHIIPKELNNIPGTQLTLKDGIELVKEVLPRLFDPLVDGIVVIQGTDTLDEISYLASLLLPQSKPVVFTGSMKGQKEYYQDAAGNLMGAMCVAASAKAKGVLVYMNQQIFLPEDVEKFHSNRMDSFGSFRGPIGAVENHQVEMWRETVFHEPYSLSANLPENIPILKSYAGMDDMLLKACLENGCAGVILEGFGSGNVQPVLVPGVCQALSKKIPVVITTRCFYGGTFASFDYCGGGADLERRGVIFTKGLNSQKARIKLAVLLGANVSFEEMATHF